MPPKTFKFNGTEGIYVDQEFSWNKIHFKIKDKHIEATFYRTWVKRKDIPKKKTFICVENFRNKTMLNALGNNGITEFGRHYEDGIKDIYKFFNLPWGYVICNLKPLGHYRWEGV